MLACHTVIASCATSNELPPVPLGGPYPVGENSNPSTSTPLKVTEHPPVVVTLFSETISPGDAALAGMRRQKAKRKIGTTRFNNVEL